jgi:hypothetical protein
MKKIKFFSSYCSQDQIHQNVVRSWGKGSDTYKDLLITKEEDYEYAILFNLALPDRFIPKERVVGFSHEPRQTLGMDPNRILLTQERVSSYYLSNSSGLPDCFKEGYSYILPFEFGKSEHETYIKKNRMSMILSLSKFMPGHLMRHQILERVLKTDMDIHFYAEGLNKIYSDQRVKEFNWSLFNVPYEDYQTQIVVENIIDGSWSTEKLSNCIIKETFPIYYGSKKIAEDFYGEDVVPMLGTNIDENMEIISEIYRTFDHKIEETRRAKDKLYQEKNLLEFLHQYFK